MHIWPSIPSQAHYGGTTHFDPANDLRGYLEGLASQIEMLRKDCQKFHPSQRATDKVGALRCKHRAKTVFLRLETRFELWSTLQF
jgi:hypothetical protein